MTTAKTTLHLTTYDTDNLQRLAEGTGMTKPQAFHTALSFCDMAVNHMRKGYYISAYYETSYSRCTSRGVSPADVAGRINNRRRDVEQTDTQLPLYRATADRLENIKKFLKVQSDTLAVAYALEFARAVFDTAQNCNNGKKATVFFSQNNNPRERGYFLDKKHPYNANPGNSFRRVARSVKNKAAAVNPFRAKPAAVKALPAPASAPPAAAQTPAPVPQQMDEIKVLMPLRVQKRTPQNNSGDQSGGFGL